MTRTDYRYAPWGCSRCGVNYDESHYESEPLTHYCPACTKLNDERDVIKHGDEVRAALRRRLRAYVVHLRAPYRRPSGFLTGKFSVRAWDREEAILMAIRSACPEKRDHDFIKTIQVVSCEVAAYD